VNNEYQSHHDSYVHRNYYTVGIIRTHDENGVWQNCNFRTTIESSGCDFVEWKAGGYFHGKVSANGHEAPGTYADGDRGDWYHNGRDIRIEVNPTTRHVFFYGSGSSDFCSGTCNQWVSPPCTASGCDQISTGRWRLAAQSQYYARWDISATTTFQKELKLITGGACIFGGRRAFDGISGTNVYGECCCCAWSSILFWQSSVFTCLLLLSSSAAIYFLRSTHSTFPSERILCVFATSSQGRLQHSTWIPLVGPG
jgi:hypothetical protein